MRLALTFAAATLALAGPATAQPTPAASAGSSPAAANDAPETRTCLSVASIRGSTVVDRQTIDFTLRDGSIWRSRLPQACPQLGTERAFTYTTGIPQLCSQDIITVIVPIMGQVNGARCGLGPFTRQPSTRTRPR
jgi:hypothetical protein